MLIRPFALQHAVQYAVVVVVIEEFVFLHGAFRGEAEGLGEFPAPQVLLTADDFNTVQPHFLESMVGQLFHGFQHQAPSLKVLGKPVADLGAP